MRQSGHLNIFLTCSQRPQQASTSSNAEPKRSLVYFPSLQSKTPTGVDGHSYIFLTYSQRPQQVSTASNDRSPYIFLIRGQRPLQAFGRSSSLGPLLNTHGFTKLNLCLSFTSVDRQCPRKTKVENAFGARAFGRPSYLGPRLHKAQLMSFFYQR